MALKFFVKVLEEVPEALRSHYRKDENGFVLDTDSDELKKVTDDFRTNNRDLKKKVDQLTSQIEQFKDIDPSKAREALLALEKIEASEDAALIKEGKVDQVISRRTAKMLAAHELETSGLKKQLEGSGKQYNELRSKYAQLLLGSELRAAANEVGTLRPGAENYLLLRARDEWKLRDDGSGFDPIGPDGSPLHGKDGKPFTMKTWLEDARDTTAFLFEDARGGGAKGGTKATGSPTRLVDPSPLELAQHAAGIAAGTIRVERTH